MDADHGHAAAEADARRTLLDAGAASLPRPPWLHGSQPPSATDLVRFAAWRAGRDDDEAAVLAGLALLAAARAEVDQTEAALMFLARSQGLSWPRIARALGLASAQAAQQRFGRVTDRVEHRRGDAT
ncbi:hypothetical protein [Actinomadura fibrosa]|uniref:DNA-binding protein n=1 Tax=Actinomadura fibrosa TaxID=111802 RepID=A0ABW2XW94_9ACTN|nr:hypothetical protein [Actinomadura fibrosa]